jgi:hypothetical protein
MESVPEDRPLPEPNEEAWDSICEFQRQLAELRDELQQQEARLASQLGGLSAGARALSALLASEREERISAVTSVRRDLEKQILAKRKDEKLSMLGDLQFSFTGQKAQAEALDAQQTEQERREAAYANVHSCLAEFAEEQEACSATIARLSRSVEAMTETSVRKTDAEWLQVSTTMLSLSETCGQLSAEVSRMTAKPQAQDRVCDGGEESEHHPPRDEATQQLHAAQPTLALPEDATRTPAQPQDVEAQWLQKLETEVSLLARVVYSNSQDFMGRLAEERSVRRAAEAVLDARIKRMEQRMTSTRASGSTRSATISQATLPLVSPVASQCSTRVQPQA